MFDSDSRHGRSAEGGVGAGFTVATTLAAPAKSKFSYAMSAIAGRAWVGKSVCLECFPRLSESWLNRG